MAISLNLVYNHRYEGNVDRLNDIYASRFSYVNHLIPFARSKASGVVPVYENSVNFSSHVAQAYDRIVKEGISHYIFAADDLLLNPIINESNVLELCGIGNNEGYTKSLASLGDAYYLWTFSTGIIRFLRSPRFDYKSELPDVSTALARYNRLGITPSKTSLRGLLHWNGKIALRDMLRHPQFVAEAVQATIRHEPEYPMLFGYSDFFVVPAQEFERFAHLCGVLGALNMFAEVAVPTALALTCSALRTEYYPGEVFAGCMPPRPNSQRQWRGKEIWDADILLFEQQYDLNLSQLMSDFPDSRIYVHPVKLSKWK